MELLQSSMVPFITILHALRLYGRKYQMSYERFTKILRRGWSLTSKANFRSSLACASVQKRFLNEFRNSWKPLSMDLYNCSPKVTDYPLPFIRIIKELISLISWIKEITNFPRRLRPIDIIELMGQLSWLASV